MAHVGKESGQAILKQTRGSSWQCRERSGGVAGKSCANQNERLFRKHPHHRGEHNKASSLPPPTKIRRATRGPSVKAKQVRENKKDKQRNLILTRKFRSLGFSCSSLSFLSVVFLSGVRARLSSPLNCLGLGGPIQVWGPKRAFILQAPQPSSPEEDERFVAPTPPDLFMVSQRRLALCGIEGGGGGYG